MKDAMGNKELINHSAELCLSFSLSQKKQKNVVFFCQDFK